jgi:cytochrome c oxidase subunit IV
VWYGKPFVTTNFGFRGIIFWGLILSLVFYFTGLLAAVFVLGLVSVLYLVFLLFAIVLIILKVTAGTIKEVRYDLLKIRGEIDYLRRKEKEE